MLQVKLYDSIKPIQFFTEKPDNSKVIPSSFKKKVLWHTLEKKRAETSLKLIQISIWSILQKKIQAFVSVAQKIFLLYNYVYS